MRTILPLVTGLGGIGSLEVINAVQIPTSSDSSEIIKIVLQVVISLATLFGLLKKKREQNN